jgi:hypothetical protein
MTAPSKQQWELGLVVGLSLVAAAAAILAGRFDSVTGTRPVVVYDHHYEHVAARTSPMLRLDGAWRSSAEGLELLPGQSGTVAIPVATDREGRLSLFVYARPVSGFRHVIAVSADGRAYKDLLWSSSLDGQRIDLTKSAGHLASFWIKVSISGSPGTGAESLRLSRIKVVEVKAPLSVPNPFVAMMVVLAPVLAYLTRRSLAGTGAVGFALAVLVGLAEVSTMWTRTADPLRWWELFVEGQRDAYFLTPYGLLLARWAWQSRLVDGPAFHLKTWSGFALTGVLLWGASLRFNALLEVGWGPPLDPDSITYMELAEAMTSPYDTGVREPLWIWMIAGWFRLVGASPLALRGLTFLLSLLVLCGAYAFTRAYTGKPVMSLLVAGFMAVNPFLVRLSTRGLREEAYVLAILALAYLLLVPHRRLSARGEAIGLAAAGAAAALLRFNSYTFLVPLLAWWVWKKPKERLAMVAIPLLFIGAVSVPHLQHNADQFGDPLFSVNAHFMWSRNYEFVILKGTGCAGCLTKEQFEINSVSGTDIGAFEYIFGMHTLGEVLSYTAEGYAKMYLSPTELFEIQSGTRSLWLFAFYVLGLGLVLFSAQREVLLLVLLLANGVPFAMSLGIDARLGIQTAPFIALILATGLTWAGAQVWRIAMNPRPWLDGKWRRASSWKWQVGG